jgi:hypothetical protein
LNLCGKNLKFFRLRVFGFKLEKALGDLGLYLG